MKKYLKVSDTTLLLSYTVLAVGISELLFPNTTWPRFWVIFAICLLSSEIVVNFIFTLFRNR
jgi:hypothetical protein